MAQRKPHMIHAPAVGLQAIVEVSAKEGRRIEECLEDGQIVECRSCGAQFTQSEICYFCHGTVLPIPPLGALSRCDIEAQIAFEQQYGARLE